MATPNCDTEAHEQMLAEYKAAAGRWAHDLLALPNLVALDTETTGLTDPRMVEIAVLAADGAVLLDTLINPGCSIPAAATAIHGIIDTDVAGAPTFSHLLPDLRRVLTDKVIVCYNAAFDAGVIANDLRHHTHQSHQHPDPMPPGDLAELQQWWEQIDSQICCAMDQYAAWCGAWNPHRRRFTWQRLPAAQGGHRAKNDCRTLLELLERMGDG